MPDTPYSTLDVLDEFRLRRWARENYVTTDRRDPAWHPIVHHEMSLRDNELEPASDAGSPGARVVPLAPDVGWTLHGPHSESRKPPVLFSVPELNLSVDDSPLLQQSMD
jgi:hypothetical protein